MNVWRINLVQTVRRTTVQAYRDDVAGLAADLAYRFFLALFPFFIFVTALGGFVAARLHVANPAQRIVNSLGGTLPPDVASVLQSELNQVIRTSDLGLLSLGVVGTLYVSASGINALFKALNRAYGVEETRPYWKRYLVAVGLTLLAGSLLVGSFLLFLAGQLWSKPILEALGAGRTWDAALTGVRWFLVVAFVLVAVSLLYWTAPNLQMRLVWTVPGAVLFTAGWGAATYVFALYLSSFATYNATYGTLAGAAILLIWFYHTSFIMLVGAELNAVIDDQVNPSEMEQRKRAVRSAQPGVTTPTQTAAAEPPVTVVAPARGTFPGAPRVVARGTGSVPGRRARLRPVLLAIAGLALAAGILIGRLLAFGNGRGHDREQ